MRTRFILFVISIFFSLHSYSQKEISRFEIDLSTTSMKTGVYSSVDKDSAHSCLVFRNKNQIIFIEFDHTLQKIVEFEFQIPNEYDGYRILNTFYSKGQPTILLANSSDTENTMYRNKINGNKFYVVSFNASEKSVHDYEFELTQNSGVYIGAIETENKFYLISIIKQSSDLWFYELNAEKKVSETKLSAQNLYFDLNTPNLHYALKTDGIDVIDNKMPTQLFDTTKKNKIYSFGDKVILTIDYSRKSTIANIFDPEEKSVETKNFFFDRSLFSDYKASLSNSFVYDNLIVQTMISKDYGLLQLTDMKSGQLKYSISFSDKTPENWNKNAKQKVNNQKLIKPSRFLNRSMAGLLSASAYKYDVLKIEMGSYQEYAGVYGLGVNGVPIPLFYMNSKYEFTFGVSLDEKYSRVETSNSEDIFDALRAFDKDLKDNSSGLISSSYRHTFRYDDSFIHGYYHKNKKEYVLVQFPFITE